MLTTFQSRQRQREVAFQSLCVRVAANDSKDRDLDLWPFFRCGTLQQRCQFGDVVRDNTVLEALTLSPISLTDEAADNYAHFLAHNPSLRAFDLIDPDRHDGGSTARVSVVRRLLVGLSQNQTIGMRPIDVYLNLVVRKVYSFPSPMESQQQAKADWKMVSQCMERANLGAVTLLDSCLGTVYSVVKGLTRNSTMKTFKIDGISGVDWYSDRDSEVKCRKSLAKLLVNLASTSKTLELVKIEDIPSTMDLSLGKIAVVAAENCTASCGVVLYGLRSHKQFLCAKFIRHEHFEDNHLEFHLPDDFKGVKLCRRTGHTSLSLRRCQLNNELLKGIIDWIKQESHTQTLHIESMTHLFSTSSVDPLVDVLTCDSTLKRLHLRTVGFRSTNVVAKIAKAIPQTALEFLELDGSVTMDTRFLDSLVRMCHRSPDLKNLRLHLPMSLSLENLHDLVARLPQMIRLSHIAFTWYSYHQASEDLRGAFLAAIRSSPHLVSVDISGFNFFAQTKVREIVRENRLSWMVRQSGTGGLTLWSHFLARLTPSRKFAALCAFVNELPRKKSTKRKAFSG